jgi:hypothetical protein
MAAAAQGLAVDRDRSTRRVPGGGRVVGAGGCWRASHAPTSWSRVSGSTRASTRRTVASAGGFTRRSADAGAPRARPAPARARQLPTRRSRPGTWRRPAPRRPPRPAPCQARAVGRGAVVGRRAGRGARAGYGTGRVPARRARPVAGQPQLWGMMKGQARRSGLVMGFDTQMIAGAVPALGPARPTQSNITNRSNPHYDETLPPPPSRTAESPVLRAAAGRQHRRIRWDKGTCHQEHDRLSLELGTTSLERWRDHDGDSWSGRSSGRCVPATCSAAGRR